MPVVKPSNEPHSFLTNDDDNPLCAPLPEKEINEALFHTMSGRAPGPERIFAEILKLGGAASIQWLKAVADQVWVKGAVPCDWQKQLTVSLHKKRNQSECDNYRRGIALLKRSCEVLCGVIINRLNPIVGPLLGRFSVAFIVGEAA